MFVTPAASLACPLDGLPLAVAERQYRCAAGHTYDMAREGYCNTLLVQHKASLDPGDSKAMVAARSRFLGAGHYEPVAREVFAVVRSFAVTPGAGGPLTVVDAGCGEGHYLVDLARRAQASPDSTAVALAGFDVSKWAIRAAARRKAPVTWLVANNKRPPFAAGSVDLMLCLFGFPVWDGFAQVQRHGGQVLLVDPGPDHLIELREIIYPAVTRTGVAPLAPAAEAAGYRLEHTGHLKFGIHLSSNSAITDLLAMTPHAHRLTPAGRERQGALVSLAVTVDVALRRLVLRQV